MRRREMAAVLLQTLEYWVNLENTVAKQTKLETTIAKDLVGKYHPKALCKSQLKIKHWTSAAGCEACLVNGVWFAIVLQMLKVMSKNNLRYPKETWAKTHGYFRLFLPCCENLTPKVTAMLFPQLKLPWDGIWQLKFFVMLVSNSPSFVKVFSKFSLIFVRVWMRIFRSSSLKWTSFQICDSILKTIVNVWQYLKN
jgi:hypothetical protein